jgi:hypothetical protein
MHDKYISFDPWWGGWNNQRMSYETAAAVSILTGRKLVVPYKHYCLFFAWHENKSSFLDPWRILDRELFFKEFNCIDFFDVPEYNTLGNKVHYFHGIDKIAKCYLFQDYPYNDWGFNKDPSSGEVLVYRVENSKDFRDFCGDRKVYNLDVPDKFIHFPRNLFAHYYFHVYGPNKFIRNAIRERIGRGIKFRKEYYSLSNKALLELGDFNAIHVRSGDFNQVHKEDTSSLLNDLKQMLEGRLDKSKPLYIATDEKDRSYFDTLKSEYKVFFRETIFDFVLDEYESLALDHIIPSEADIFLGTKWSTFTDAINCMRGFAGKKDFSRQGINFNYPPLDKNIIPWNQEDYTWQKIYHSHWTAE